MWDVHCVICVSQTKPDSSVADQSARSELLLCIEQSVAKDDCTELRLLIASFVSPSHAVALTSRYSWFVNWWEQRDLNPPSGFLLKPPSVCGQSVMQQVGAPVGHQLQQTHLSFLCNGARDTTELYSLGLPAESVLSPSACFLRRSFFLRHFHL